MRQLLPVLVALALASSGCKTLPTPALTNEAMMESTVQIEVTIKGVIITSDGREQEGETGWTGSGVVYRIIDTGTKRPQSLILTANHVLDVPKVGEVIVGADSVAKITSVEMQVDTEDGRVCKLTSLVVGESTTEDVATGLADCVAGRPARIAGSDPVRGDSITIVGHPLGFPLPVLTTGTVDGWTTDGFLAVSAPAYGGNSGGPVYYHGSVIGLLVRGSREYSFISLVTPLQPILDRIKATDKLLGL